MVFRGYFSAGLLMNGFFVIAVTAWLAGIVGFSIKEALGGQAPSPRA